MSKREGTSACGWCLDRQQGLTKKPCHGGACDTTCPCPGREGGQA